MRRLKCASGPASEVARLIEAEYIPQLADVDGLVSSALVGLSEDEVTSLGVFTNEAGAARAKARAQTWAKDRLADLGTSPLEAFDGKVVLHSTFPV